MSEVRTGKIGEVLCLLRLTQLGLQAEIVHSGTTDILVFDGPKLWRVQVKASNKKGNKGKDHKRSVGYQFCVSKGLNPKKPLTLEDCDIVALVAIDREKVMFAPVEHFNNVKTKRVRLEDFDQPNIEASTWNACMDWYKTPGL